MRVRVLLVLALALALTAGAHPQPPTPAPLDLPPRPAPPARVYYQEISWQILLVDRVHDDTGADDLDSVGFAHVTRTDHRFGTLEIVRNQEPDDEADTIYHELEHVVTGQEFIGRTMLGHRAIESLTPMWVIIGQNPTLATYFHDVYSYEEEVQ